MIFVFDMSGTLHPANDAAENSYKDSPNPLILPDLFSPRGENIIEFFSKFRTRIHIATGAVDPWKSDVLNHLGIDLPGDNIHYLGNKSIDKWQAFIEELGGNPGDICVIGDAVDKDITLPKKLGCKTIWIKPATSGEHSEADFEVISLEEAIKLCYSLQH